MWDLDSLWAKSRLYAARASAVDREDAEFPFWSILTLEMLARSALASVHPALLADPREGQNLMYAFGFGQTKAPRSIPAKTVFLRCAQIVQDFTADDVTKATALIEMRNEELHTGGTPLDGLPTRTWLVDYYRLSKTLLVYLDKGLGDLFEDDEAVAAKRMIDASDKKILGEVKRAVSECRKEWRALTKEDRKERRTRAVTILRLRGERASFRPAAAGDVQKCPACTTLGWVTGEVVRTGEPRVGENEILQTFTKLPTEFSCSACGLSLDGEAEMHAAGRGDLYEVEIGEDPASYYGIETADSVRDYDYDAYGND
jgi:hypothetical protein